MSRYVAYLATDYDYDSWWRKFRELLEESVGYAMALRLEALAVPGDGGPWLVTEGERALLQAIPGFYHGERSQGAFRFKELPEEPSDEWFLVDGGDVADFWGVSRWALRLKLKLKLKRYDRRGEEERFVLYEDTEPKPNLGRVVFHGAGLPEVVAFLKNYKGESNA